MSQLLHFAVSQSTAKCNNCNILLTNGQCEKCNKTEEKRNTIFTNDFSVDHPFLSKL